MADEMYGDGGVDFAKQLYQEQRNRKEETAREQEKFAKKLLIADTAVKGINFLINQRADTLDANNAPAKAAYKNYLKGVEDKQIVLKDYNNSDNKQRYIENYIVSQTEEDIKKEFSTVNETLLDGFIRKNARNKAKLLVPDFDRMYKELSEVVSFDDYVKNYDVISKKENPRSIFGAATKSIKNIFKAETPDSIVAKEKKSKDLIYGSPIYNDIQEYKEAVKPINASLDLKDLLDNILQAKKDGKLTGKVIKSEIVDVPTLDGKSTIKALASITTDIDGVQQLNLVRASQDFRKPIKQRVYTTEEHKNAYAEFITLLNNIDSKEYKNVYDEITDNEGPSQDRAYSLRVLEIKENLDVSIREAAAYITKQLVTFMPNEDGTLSNKTYSIASINSNPTLYEFDLANNIESEEMYKNTSKYFKDVNTRFSTDAPIQIRDIILEKVMNDKTLSEDAKVEYEENIRAEFAKVTNLDPYIKDSKASKVIALDGNDTETTDIGIKGNVQTEALFEVNKNIWEQSGNVDKYLALNRKYLNNFEDVVNNLNYSNLDIYQLDVLSRLSEKELQKILGIPSSIKFEKRKVSRNLGALKEAVGKAIENYDYSKNPELFAKEKSVGSNKTFTTRKKVIGDKKENMPSIEFFEEFRKQLLTP